MWNTKRMSWRDGKTFQAPAPSLPIPWLFEFSFSNSLLLPALSPSLLFLHFILNCHVFQYSRSWNSPPLLLSPASTPNLTHPLGRRENEDPSERRAIKQNLPHTAFPANSLLIFHLCRPWSAPHPAQLSCFPGRQQLKARQQSWEFLVMHYREEQSAAP